MMRQPGAAGISSGGPGFGPGGRRPGGVPKKRVAAAGKKLKQTQITTPAEHKRVIRMGDTIAVAELAKKMAVKGREIIKKLWALGMMDVNINKDIDLDTATLIATEFGFQIESTAFREDELLTEQRRARGRTRRTCCRGRRSSPSWATSTTARRRCSTPSARPTSRPARRAASPSTSAPTRCRGDRGDVVFLDTPGHEAFTAMRARGAQMTDIVVLVVAADDGADAADDRGDQPRQGGARFRSSSRSTRSTSRAPTRTRSAPSCPSTTWSRRSGAATTIFVNVSAKTKEGVDKLLEMLALQAEVLELRANPNKPAQGARRRGAPRSRARRHRDRPGRGGHAEASATCVVAGEYSGKIRAMLGDKGQAITEAGPSTPVEVLGLDGVPDAGEIFNVVSRREGGQVAGRAPARRSGARRSWRGQRPRVAGEHPRQDQGGRGQRGQGRAQGRRAGLGRGGGERAHQALDRRRSASTSSRRASAASPSRTSAWRKASAAVVIGLQRPPGGQGPAAGRAGGRRHQAVPGHLRRHRRREEGDGRHAGADHAREGRSARRRCGRSSTSRRRGRSPAASSPKARSRARRSCASCATRSSSTRARSARCGGSRTTPREVAQGYECGLSIEGYGDLREGDVIEAFEVESVRADARELGRRRQAVRRRVSRARDGRRSRASRSSWARATRSRRSGWSCGKIKDLVRGKVQRVDRRGRGERPAGSGRCWACRWSGAIGASRSRRWTRCCASSAGTCRSRTRRRSCRSFGDELVGPDFKHWEE